MGNAASASAAAPAPISAATHRLHAALDRLADPEPLARALRAPCAADANALRPVDATEQFIIFAPPAEQAGDGAAFALTALGRLASQLLSHAVAIETGAAPSAVDRDTGARVVAALVAAGADVGAPLHARAPRGGAWARGSATLVDALRLMAAAARARGGDAAGRAREAFLAPTLLAALRAVPVISALDLVFWAGVPDVAALVVARGLACAAPPPRGGELLPPLVAAVDAGSAATVRALLEAGADVNARAPGGATPLMRAAGAEAFVLPAPGSVFCALGEGGGGAAGAGADDEAELAHRPTRALVEALLHAGADVAAADASHQRPSGKSARSRPSSAHAATRSAAMARVSGDDAGVAPVRTTSRMVAGDIILRARARDF